MLSAAMCSKFDIYRFAVFVVAKFPYMVGKVKLLEKITINFIQGFPVLKVKNILKNFNFDKSRKTAVQADLRNIGTPNPDLETKKFEKPLDKRE